MVTCSLSLYVKKVVAGLSCLALLFISNPNTISASGNLELARDAISTLAPEVPNITHEVYFVVPLNSPQIRNTDYIIIDLPNYQLLDISGAYTIGGFGNPSFSKSGTKLLLTGLAVLPGGSLTITGFRATNPAITLNNQITVTVAEDASGINVKNAATIIPSDSRNSVNVTATIQSPLAAFNINGFTSPSAFVTLTENTTVIATTVANGLGQFTFNLTAIIPGAHSYQVFATDSQNRGTAQTTLNAFLVGNTLSTANGITLSSTLSLSTAVISPGQPITFSGSARPNTQINIFVEAPLRSFTATTDASGNWQYTISGSDTETYTPGEYRAYTIAQDSLGNQSVVSNTLTFVVSAPADPNNPAPSCDISRGDLNCNSITNLTDFSILLFHWNTDRRVADINNDGSVNLVDFSIMMFYYVQ